MAQQAITTRASQAQPVPLSVGPNVVEGIDVAACRVQARDAMETVQIQL